MFDPRDDEFRRHVRAMYERPAAAATPAEVASRLDDALREIVARQWETILFLEAQVAKLKAGCPPALLEDVLATLNQVVTTWQEAMLARPRSSVTADDTDFRRSMRSLYDKPCDPATPAALAHALDEHLAGSHENFWSLIHQLHLIANELARTQDADIAAQATIVLGQLPRAWGACLLDRPRAVSSGPSAC